MCRGGRCYKIISPVYEGGGSFLRWDLLTSWWVFMLTDRYTVLPNLFTPSWVLCQIASTIISIYGPKSRARNYKISVLQTDTSPLVHLKLIFNVDNPNSIFTWPVSCTCMSVDNHIWNLKSFYAVPKSYLPSLSTNTCGLVFIIGMYIDCMTLLGTTVI